MGHRRLLLVVWLAQPRGGSKNRRAGSKQEAEPIDTIVVTRAIELSLEASVPNAESVDIRKARNQKKGLDDLGVNVDHA